MMGMGRFTGFAAVAGTMGVLASLAAPAEAFTQKGVGLVTAIRGSVNVAHTADVAARERRPVQEPLRFREDVFFLDTIRTEREATAKLLLRARSTLTIRELSQVQLREGTAPAPGRTRSIVSLVSGALRALIQRDLRPQDEFEIHTPNAISAVRGSEVATETYGPGQAPPDRLREIVDLLPRGTPPPRPDEQVTLFTVKEAVGEVSNPTDPSRVQVAFVANAIVALIGARPPLLALALPDLVNRMMARFLVASGVGPAGAHASQQVSSAQGQAAAEGRGGGQGYGAPPPSLTGVIIPLSNPGGLVTTATFSGFFSVSSFSASGSGFASPGALGGSFDFQMDNTGAVGFSPAPLPVCSPCSGSLQGTARVRTPAGGGPGTVIGSFSGPVVGGGTVSGAFQGNGSFTSGGSTSVGTLNLSIRGGMASFPIKLTTD